MTLLVAVLLALQVAVGLGNHEARSRHERAIIIGGDDAKVDNFPYQVSLRVFRQHACGASVIGPTWILSAAHCCVGVDGDAYSVRAGSSRSDIGGAEYQVKTLVPHPLYNSVTMDFDICAIEIASKFQASRLIRAIPMDPITLTYPPKAFVIISGWGRTANRPGSAGSNQLQSALVSIYDHAQCKALYKRFGTVTYVTERQICAGADPSGTDACQGDSGGPLAYNGRLVGVVSWGIGCGDKRFPGIYTSVAALRGWIFNTTGI